MDMWVPRKEKKKKTKQKGRRSCMRETDEWQRVDFLKFLFFKSLFSDSRKFDRRNSLGKTRKVLYATRATRGYQNHGISPKILVKIQEIQVF